MWREELLLANDKVVIIVGSKFSFRTEQGQYFLLAVAIFACPSTRRARARAIDQAVARVRRSGV